MSLEIGEPLSYQVTECSTPQGVIDTFSKMGYLEKFYLTLEFNEPAVFLVTKIAVFAPYGGPAHCGSQLVHRVAVGFRRGRPVNPFSANPPHFTHGAQNDFVHNCLPSLHLPDAESPFFKDPDESSGSCSAEL